MKHSKGYAIHKGCQFLKRFATSFQNNTLLEQYTCEDLKAQVQGRSAYNAHFGLHILQN